MKILVISPNNADAPAFYRSVAPFAELSRSHADIQMTDGANLDLHWGVLKPYDVVFLSRPCRQQDLQVAYMAKEWGIPLWVDYDDNVLDVNEDNPTSLFFSMQGVRDLIIKVLSLADVLTVSTSELVGVYMDYCDNIKVIPNAWDDRALPISQRPLEQTSTILYRGSNTHNIDVYEHTDELIDNIVSSHGWDWVFLGFHPWWLSYEMKGQKKMVQYPSHEKTGLYYKDYVDIAHYFHIIKTLAPSLMIVPLSNTPFNKAKSNIAFIEGAYAGAATLAPEYLPEFDRPGVIRYKDAEDFGKKLNQIVRKKIDLKQAADGSWEYVRENLSLTKINDKRVDILHQLVK